MCVVSAIHDYGQKLWPDIAPVPWINPMTPSPAPMTPPDLSELLKRIEIGKNAQKSMIKIIDPDEALNPKDDQPRLPTAAEIKAFKKLVAVAERFDEIAKQAHCEDPEKVKLMAQLDERLARIEEAVGIAPAPSDTVPSVHHDTLEMAKELFQYLNSRLGTIVPFENLREQLEALFPEGDMDDAMRRANAAYLLLNEA